jgi:hypothetical protein
MIMNLKKAPPILSRILLAISSLVMVGVVFYFVSKSLEPVELIPPMPPRQAEVFNPKADISKNPAFQKLQPTHMEPVPDLPMGRANPFDPVSFGSAEIIESGGVSVPRSALRLVPVSTTTQDSESVTETNVLF